MVLNNEVLLVELVILIRMGRRAIHIGERQILNQEHNFWSAFCHKPKSLETIGGINPKKEEAMGRFPSGQTKMDCVLGNILQLAYNVHTNYCHLSSSFNHFCSPSFPS